MSKIFLASVPRGPACPCAGFTDPRQIIQEVQKRQHSDSQRYEGTLEVIGGGKQRGHQALGVPAHRHRSATARRFCDSPRQPK